MIVEKSQESTLKVSVSQKTLPRPGSVANSSKTSFLRTSQKYNSAQKQEKQHFVELSAPFFTMFEQAVEEVKVEIRPTNFSFHDRNSKLIKAEVNLED